jgi:hypothetical protein
METLYWKQFKVRLRMKFISDLWKKLISIFILYQVLEFWHALKNLIAFVCVKEKQSSEIHPLT